MNSTPPQWTPDRTAYERDLEDRVRRFLQLNATHGMENVRAEVQGGIVILRGRVSSERDRSLGTNCCRHVPGVLPVIDKLTAAEELRPTKRQAVYG